MRILAWLLTSCLLVVILFVWFELRRPTHRYHEMSGELVEIGNLELGGSKDVLLMQSDSLVVVPRDKDGGLMAPIALTKESRQDGILLLADLNADGFPDILSNTGSVWFGDGADFEEADGQIPAFDAGEVTDFNGDGQMDLLAVQHGTAASTDGEQVQDHFVVLPAVGRTLKSKGEHRFQTLRVLDAKVDDFSVSWGWPIRCA